jgi:hypothetical protein
MSSPLPLTPPPEIVVTIRFDPRSGRVNVEAPPDNVLVLGLLSTAQVLIGTRLTAQTTASPLLRPVVMPRFPG